MIEILPCTIARGDKYNFITVSQEGFKHIVSKIDSLRTRLPDTTHGATNEKSAQSIYRTITFRNKTVKTPISQPVLL